MEGKKKILFCIDALKPGGAEIIMCNIVNELVKDKTLDITIQLLQDKCELEVDRRVHLKKFMKYGLVYRKFIKWTPARILHTLIIRDKYDFEIAFMEGASTKVISGCRNESTTTYAWVHTDMEKYPWSKRSYRNSKEEFTSYTRIDKVFAVSTDVKNVFSKLFQKKAVFVQNVIDDTLIEEKAKEVSDIFDKKRFNIVSVGTIKPVKGFERLLEVHSVLQKEGIDCVHYILGDGPVFSELKEQIKNANLEERIILKGYLKNPYPWIREAALFVCVSYAEGYSSVVSEAVILSTPILTTECSGMKDILGESEYGLIVDNHNKAIIDGLRKLITDKENYQHYVTQVKKRRENFRMSYLLEELRKNLEF